MEKLRKEIIKINKFNLSYYNSLLDIIDNYQEEKPDITIETCKALIEGISKLILHVIKQEPISELDKSNNLQDIFKNSLVALNNKHKYFNDEFVKRTGSMIHVLGEIRNKQGDICHGRVSTKEQINCQDFAEMVAGMTEVLCIYILRKFDEISVTPILYENYSDYNNWLDDSIENFPILTEKYSKVLFDYDKDFYYTNYIDIFLPSLENEKIESKEIESEKPSETFEIQTEKIKSKFFNSEESHTKLVDFARKEHLKFDKFIDFIDNYLFTNEMATKNELKDFFIYAPIKTEEKLKVEQLKEKIKKFIFQLI